MLKPVIACTKELFFISIKVFIEECHNLIHISNIVQCSE